MLNLGRVSRTMCHCIFTIHNVIRDHSTSLICQLLGIITMSTSEKILKQLVSKVSLARVLTRLFLSIDLWRSSSTLLCLGWAKKEPDKFAPLQFFTLLCWQGLVAFQAVLDKIWRGCVQWTEVIQLLEAFGLDELILKGDRDTACVEFAIEVLVVVCYAHTLDCWELFNV